MSFTVADEVNPKLLVALDRAQELQVFPMIAKDLVRVGNDPNADIQKIERIVSQDPFISARILHMANSPYYGLMRSVSSVQQAMSIMGFKPALDLALGLAMAQSPVAQIPQYKLFWRHSLKTAVLAKELAAIRGESCEDFYLAALLHDIGRMILLAVYTDDYLPLSRPDMDGTIKLLISERRLFGFNHAELGKAALERWRLPEQVCAIIEAHHANPPKRRAAKITPLLRNVAIIALAEHVELAHSAKVPEEEIAKSLHDHPYSQNVLWLTPKECETYVAKLPHLGKLL